MTTESGTTTLSKQGAIDNVCDEEELGRRLGRAAGTIHKWRYRHPDFPEAADRVGGAPWWWWPEVLEWARATGRVQR